MWLNKRDSSLLTSLVQTHTPAHKPVSSKKMPQMILLSESDYSENKNPMEV